MTAGSDSKLDSEEAEYAWLSIDSLKPFREGDSLAFEEDKHISDPTLKACIAAAERAVKAAADRAAAAADEAEQEGEDLDDDSQSDSDGGLFDSCTLPNDVLSTTWLNEQLNI